MPSERPGDDGDAATRVLIVEDHRVVAEGLAALINAHADLQVVGSVGTVADCVQATAELSPDVILLDFRLPDGTGPDAAAAIRGIRPATKMIFLTREDTEAARFAAVQSGASAFVHKSRAAADVVSAIRDVARGRRSTAARGRCSAAIRCCAIATKRPSGGGAEDAGGAAGRTDPPPTARAAG